MKLNERGIISKIGKACAGPLSLIVANPATQGLSRIMEAYWSILLGKGCGTGWAHDVEVRAACRVIKNPSPTIFDVGANRGEWSLLIKEALPNARLFLFEPQTDCQHEILARNIADSTLIPFAVSSEKGAALIHTYEGVEAIASLHERRDSCFEDRKSRPIPIETVTLDGVIQEHNLTCVDFLKLDIEGHEIEALKGAETSLKDGIIRALSFEFGSGNINSRTYFHDFYDLLCPMGYQLHRILPSSRLLSIKEYCEDCEHFRGVTNYLAVRDEARTRS